MQLAAAGASDEEEEIELGGQFAQVENDNLLATVVVGNLRGGNRQLQTAAWLSSADAAQSVR